MHQAAGERVAGSEGFECLWDTQQVARFLNMSPSWVSKHRDRIPHLRLGRRVLHEPDQVRAFARKCSA